MKNNTLGWKLLIMSILLFAAQPSRAQDDLMKALEEKTATSGPVYTTGTFKGTRLINGHTVETRGKKVLDFIISHRFGTLNSGAYHFFGLDQAYIRLGLDYGITDRLNVGIGRSSYQKTFDGFVKYKILQQSTDVKAVPFSAVLFLSSAYQSENSVDPNENRSANDRMAYVSQLLLARKFSQKLSLQLMPTVVHRNFVKDLTGPNTMVALGVGGRYKLTKRTSLNAEYYYRFLPGTTQGYYNSLALGVDIETGGHVFQFHLTNSRGMIERAFITDTTGDFFAGDIHLGFNISRTFQLGKKKKVSNN
jgi:hypothetical protein